MKLILYFTSLLVSIHFCFAQEPKLVLPIGHTSFVNVVQYSPNEEFVLTASSDALLKLWNKNTGKLLQTYAGHTQSINTAIFNKEGNLIASASNDSTIIIWETITGKILHQLKGHNGAVKHIEFKHQTNELLSSSFVDGTVKIWNINNGNLIEDINALHINHATYNSNQQWLLLRLDNNNAAVCTYENNTNICYSLAHHKSSITKAVFLPDTSGIITASLDSSLIFWTIRGQIKKIIKLNFPIDDFLLSADNKKIVIIADNAPYTEVRNIADTTLLGSFGINDNLYANRIKAKFSTTNQYLFLALNDTDSAFVFDVNDRIKKVASFFTQHDVVNDVQFNNDGNQFVLASTKNNFASTWQIGINEPIISYKGFTNFMNNAFTAINDSLTIVQSPFGRVEVWNSYLNNLLYAIPKKIINLKITKSENKIITIDHENIIEVWYLKSGKLLQQINAGIIPSDYIQETPLWAVNTIDKIQKPIINHQFNKTIFHLNVSCVNSHETLLATASTQTDGVAVWNLQNGSLAFNLKIGVEGIFDIAFSSNNKYLIAVGRNGVAVYVDLLTKEIFTLQGHTSNIKNVQFHPNNNFIYTSGYDSTIKIWNTHNQQLIQTIQVNEPILQLSIAAQKNVLLAVSSKNIKAWNLKNFTLQYAVAASNNFIKQVQFFHQSPHLLVSFYDNEAPIILHEQTGKRLFTLSNAMIGNTSIAKNDSIILTTYGDKISKWNLHTNQLITSFVSISTADYLSLTANKYYKCTPNASKQLHYVTNDLKVISFEQLDIKYHRPDKVLQAIGNTDTTLISAYYKAYVKRINKLGIDTTQFKEGYNVPEADFLHRNKIEYLQTKNKLTLTIYAVDNNSFIDRMNIWINDVPLFGLHGLKTNKKNTLDTTITITLSQGENNIETSVINTNGIESYRIPLIVKYQPSTPKIIKTHFIGIGIDEFADATYNLQWSVKDIKDLALKLKTKYPNIIIDTLFNKNVTKENIIHLKKKLFLLNEDDIVIVSYSGHGVLSKDFDYYLSTYAINFNQPNMHGIAYDDFENLLDSIKPRKKLMLIDACHSGEVDKEELTKIENLKTQLNKNGVVANKSTIKITEKKKSLGMKNSFELMQSLFVNVSKGTGATIISAAGGTQYAQERSDLKNGVFTYSILDAFNNNSTLKVAALKKIVSDNVIKLTNGLQQPTSRNETNHVDWIVW